MTSKHRAARSAPAAKAAAQQHVLIAALRASRYLPLACLLVAAAGCSSLPGKNYPRPPTPEPVHAPSPQLTSAALQGAPPSAGRSGFRMYSTGIDGLLLRLELIRTAQRSLDLQYYILHGDESGKLITEALLTAARRGVRVRILVDDGETEKGDEQVFALASEPNVAIRVFNPWHYRGHSIVLRSTEFLFAKSRLDHRMHNKLFIADGVVALIGGRNIGDQYFQVDPGSQYADDDVLVTGKVTEALNSAFEEYWTSQRSVPVQAFVPAKQRDEQALERLAARHTTPQRAASSGSNFVAKLQADEPLADVLSGSAQLSWAAAELSCDSPDKTEPDVSRRVASLMFAPVARAIRETKSQLIMVTPYLIPAQSELRMLQEVDASGRRVRVLTTSLEAATDPAAQAGYNHFRVPLLRAGVDLYELRRQPEHSRGTGQSRSMIRHGNFGLHGKLLVFDRSAVYVGSMNYDARSRWINTEIGLIIHSPELATEVDTRFAQMTQPGTSYHVTLVDDGPKGHAQLRWSTVRDGKPVEYTREPAHSGWQRLQVRVLSLLPIDSEL
jgi:cardiolipin synthase C